MTNLITEAREQIAHLNGAKLAFEQNGFKTAVGIMVNTVAILDRLCDALEKAEAQIESIHRSLDFAETQRQRSKSYTELAVNNGLALGRIAVTIQHDFAPLPAPPEEGE